MNPQTRNRNNWAVLLAAGAAFFAASAWAEPEVKSTAVIGPFTGAQAPLHPDNLSPQRIAYSGTDLGWTYEHQGELKILFGDTAVDAGETPIEASTGGRFDDAYGSVDLSVWNRPESFSRDNMPVIRLGQNPGTTEAAAIDPGQALELFKTPVGGFSNGEDEFGVFFTYKPTGCRTSADCSNGAACDTGLGYIGPHYLDETGLTWACVDGSSPICNAATMVDASGQPVADSGFCTVPESPVWADTEVGRRSALAVELVIGRRDRETPKRYHPEFRWHTNRFMNPAFRTVQAFEPPGCAPDEFEPDFGPATTPSNHSKLFIWGRPHFLAVKAAGRYAGQYFAYVELPGPERLDWRPQYFAGLDEHGRPKFSPRESDAALLDQDSTLPGIQPETRYDVIDQVSVAWVPQLSRWIEFYGGGMTTRPLPPILPNCGVLELFTGSECTQVDVGNGAFRMRSSAKPWGPWTRPQDVIVGGDPTVAEGQYGPGGVFYHPQCQGPDCAPHTGPPENADKEYGFFYAPNIIEQWTRPAGDGVDIYWNASTWDPYRVILLRTRIE